ncbi:MAG TPA: M15 family metallopeptidase [Acidimicrobiia bacterium]|nr:M15 family metallopeptidase [Acidimicrobiia bacterium]
MRRVLLVAMVALVTACSSLGGDSASTSTTSTLAPTTNSTLAPTTTTTVPATTTTINPFARPEWMGTRVLPLRADGYGEAQPTPPEFDPRAMETPDVFLPPSDEHFRSSIGPIPPDVLARSSWVPECPVTVDELAYLTVSHYGFDGRFHTGEIIVNLDFAEEVVEVFRLMHEARFPIEQIRVITKEEIDAPPTGDWNDTTSFVCRPAVGSISWSQHAYGLAIDVNPFHNPYLNGDLVLPELASTYTDREDVRPGMITDGDVVVEAFADMGWGWGGNWDTLKDWMHFSFTGR